MSVLVLCHKSTHVRQEEAIAGHHLFAQQLRQELIEGDVLDLSHHNSPRLL